jgi:hypothetical protein
MRSQAVDEIISRFLTGEDTAMIDSVIPPDADPEAVWLAVLRIVQHDLSEDQISILAAGPVEDLLAWHGEQYIDRIEAEAHRNPAFAHILDGTWRHDIPQAIWQRVEAARGGKVW